MSVKRASIVLAVVALVVALALSPARRWATDFVGWVRDQGSEAAVVYGLVYIVAAVVMIPGSALTLGAGFIYGPIWGVVLVAPASIAAALISFAIARRVARRWVAHRIEGHRTFAALDRAVGRSGFKITLLVRLAPIFPYGLLNYTLGITGVRFRDYAAATAIGMFPATILYVYLGSVVTTASELGTRPAGGWLYWSGAALALVVVVAVTWVARRALRRELEEATP